jgi:hypothetical protein
MRSPRHRSDPLIWVIGGSQLAALFVSKSQPTLTGEPDPELVDGVKFSTTSPTANVTFSSGELLVHRLAL